jgi:4'-phosphopantetheinyl transferase EntD
MTVGGELADLCDVISSVSAWISQVAPGETAFAVDGIRPSAAFDAAEATVVARAVASRRDEFTTGRRLAREALERLGGVAVGLPPDSDRVPQWPDGFIGTISHSDRLCAALVGRTHDFLGIGFDIEKRIRIDSGLRLLICRPDEIELEKTRDFNDTTLLRFVAKEAFFKAYFPATRNFLDFLDIRVSLDLALDSFEATLMKPSSPSLNGSRTFVGHFAIIGSYLVAGVWIAR